MLPIPQNVWFIGTANTDESTYEITRKVYDRAQVLQFDERLPRFSAQPAEQLDLTRISHKLNRETNFKVET